MEVSKKDSVYIFGEIELYVKEDNAIISKLIFMIWAQAFLVSEKNMMEKNNVNLEIIRQDWLSELRNMQMKFIEDFDKGQDYPSSDKSA